MEMPEIEPWKISRNSNGHNFSHGSPIQEHHISELEIEQQKLWRNSKGHNFPLGCSIQAHQISRRSKLNNGTSQEIQMVITFHSEVRFRRIIFRDPLN